MKVKQLWPLPGVSWAFSTAHPSEAATGGAVGAHTAGAEAQSIESELAVSFKCRCVAHSHLCFPCLRGSGHGLQQPQQQGVGPLHDNNGSPSPIQIRPVLSFTTEPSFGCSSPQPSVEVHCEAYRARAGTCCRLRVVMRNQPTSYTVSFLPHCPASGVSKCMCVLLVAGFPTSHSSPFSPMSPPTSQGDLSSQC